MKFPTHKLSLAGAYTSAVFMLVLSLLNSIGLYENATLQMQEWHLFYTPTILGTIYGMVEAAIVTYIFLFVFGWFYNRSLSEKK